MKKIWRGLAPSELAARKYTSSMDSTPRSVFSTVAKKDPRKVRKMMDASRPGHIRIDNGTQASMGMGRKVSSRGKV